MAAKQKAYSKLVSGNDIDDFKKANDWTVPQACTAFGFSNINVWMNVIRLRSEPVPYQVAVLYLIFHEYPELIGFPQEVDPIEALASFNKVFKNDPQMSRTDFSKLMGRSGTAVSKWVEGSAPSGTTKVLLSVLDELLTNYKYEDVEKFRRIAEAQAQRYDIDLVSTLSGSRR